VHEAGVDEPDLVKTDGKRIITVNRGVLRVVDAATKEVTGTLHLVPEDQPWVTADLLVHGDRALVMFTSGEMIPLGATVKRPAFGGPRYTLVDLSGTPKELGSISPQGFHVDARMVGSTVRVVVRSQPEIEFPDAGPDATDAERTRRNQEAVRRAPIEAWLPRYEISTAGGASRTEAVACDRISHPREYTGTSLLTVHTLDLAKDLPADPAQSEAPTDPIAVAADGDTVYGTADSLYVTSNPRWWFPMPIDPIVMEDDGAAPTSPPDTPAVSDQENTASAPDAVATVVPPRDQTQPPEPTVPTDAPAETPGATPEVTPPTPTADGTPEQAPATDPPAPTPTMPPEETEVHRFDVTGTGAPRYVASGKVPGRLLNQYSLSEHDGHLRVATTLTPEDGGPDAPASSSGVYVLRSDSLAKVGEVTGLGKGERIYSVRFIGPTGYVVTFRQVDPLYTLDLRDPAAPKVTGELKITGYSAYLHPAGDGRLIGIGQEAGKQGRTLGTQVSLFDVSDPAAPRRLAQYHQKDSGSEAEWDPHAFLFWPDTGLAIVPLMSWDREGLSHSAALALRIDADGIDRLGEISHPRPNGAPKREIAPVDSSIRRSIVIGDELWTVSDTGVKVNNATNLNATDWIPFT
jgi:hypothetical protein